MTEKATRIAKLEREIVEWEKEALAANKDGDAYIAEENLTHLRAELTRLRNEQPKGGDGPCYFITGGDGQTYEARYDLPLPSESLTQGEGSEPVGWEYKSAEGWERLSLENYEILKGSSFELRPVYASPPPPPAGNADPRVREALERHLRDLVDLASDPSSEANSPDTLVREFTKRICSTIVALPSPQSQGLVEAAEWQPIETAPRDGSIILIDTNPEIESWLPFTARLIEGVYEFPPGTVWIAAPLRSRASDRSA